MSPTTIGVLHVTDLHFGLERPAHLWPNIRERLYEDLRRYHPTNGPWDLLLFTGDLTQRGAAEEFNGLDHLLHELLTELKKLGSNPLVLAVPGNHDLVRPGPAQDPYLLECLARWGEKPKLDELLWVENSPPRRLLSEAFRNYCDWSARWYERQKDRFESYRTGRLPGDFSVTVRFGEYPVGIVGLNSAFLQLSGGDFHRKLVIDPKQFHGVCDMDDGPHWVKRHSLCFLLTHHGPDWLCDVSREAYEAEIYAPDWFFAHFHGHTHENTQISEARAGLPPRRVWQARSLFGLETFGDKQLRSHGYTALRLTLDHNECVVRRWPRSATRGGGSWNFHVDTTIAHDTDNGTTPEKAAIRRPMGLEGCPKTDTGDSAWKQSPSPPTAPSPTRRFTKQAHGGEQLNLLDEKIVAARARRENLAREKLSTREVDEEIVTLRRKKRDGVPLEPGDSLPSQNAEYVLCERLGYGGFGAVWKAKNAASDQFVAIKVLHGQYANDQTRIERFSRGSRALSSMSHPNIVSLIEPYQKVNGYHFFVMQYIQGPTLSELVEGNDFRVEQIPHIIQQMCDAVAYAHDFGFIHRDIKPSNILFSENRLYLTDFDLVLGSETSGGTREHNPMGTISYAAPEQFTNPDTVTEAADVCSIARCAMFMYLRENPPFEVASSPAKVVRRISATDAVRDVLKKGSQPNPKSRFKSVREFLDAFQDSLTAKDTVQDRHVLMKILPEFPLSIISVPEGEFLMGTPNDPDDEFPHVVQLSAFGIGETVVTEGQWRVVMKRQPDSSLFTGDPQMPVVGVSWFEAIWFLNRLSEMHGFRPCYRTIEGEVIWDVQADGFRLPTEAEWEYAARAGTDTAYSFGETTRRLKEHAWNGKHARDRVHAVKQLKPNPWHLYDVHGNVREWVWDWSGGYPRGEVSNPIGPEYGTNRVVRGGNVEIDPVYLRSAARASRSPSSFSDTVGFRIAISLQRFVAAADSPAKQGSSE